MTDKPVAFGFQIKLEFRNVGFLREEKTGVPEEKPLNKLSLHCTYDGATCHKNSYLETPKEITPLV